MNKQATRVLPSAITALAIATCSLDAADEPEGNGDDNADH